LKENLKIWEEPRIVEYFY